VVLVVLLADAIVAICVAVFYGFPLLIALGLVAGLCSSLGKLSLDAMIQRDVPETVRTSVFARSETVLQLAWVIGGGCGIVLPLIPRLGFGFLAAVLAVVVFLVIRQKPGTATPRTAPSSSGRSPSDPGPSGPAASGGPADHGEPPERHETRPVATARTILTSPTDPTAIQRISDRRAADDPRPREGSRYNEPTVELRFDPADDGTPRPEVPKDGQSDDSRRTEGQQVGRWWSGQPDDDDTVQDEAPWSNDPTLERKPGGLFRRRPGSRPPR